jgi:hypothetical protein
MRRGDFEDLVRRHLDSVLVPRGFTLTPQPPSDWDDEQPRAVYEADPEEFNRRYPAIAVGDDVPCIDVWIELDPGTGRISGSLEGPTVDELSRRLGLGPPASGPAGMEVGLQLTDLGTRLSEILDAAGLAPSA